MSTDSTTTEATTPSAPGGAAKFARLTGLILLIAGIVFVLAGGTTWGVVTSQLKAEEITISEDARWFAGQQVGGPLTAFSQADIINTHALHATEGRTYAELGAAMSEVEEGSAEHEELAAQRATVMNASFLRASLFTSVVAYGVAALVVGLGVLLGFAGVAFRKLGATA
ncbi:aromatic ring-opening dioxygenase LigA [Occultella gossypii]|uniref:Aromatic ring-opening dioxygenase LigA n=1 Tax=Occultella gossypii TaxID=2800820 RepID=A0ABS7S691_9MICO|nr:aromatic ring-opening dioxygenase LigA [Occultella gossypii]MBZ2195802.1 aromatic ring-opening dioxygenase LigA [Occultella gossypii]